VPDQPLNFTQNLTMSMIFQTCLFVW